MKLNESMTCEKCGDEGMAQYWTKETQWHCETCWYVFVLDEVPPDGVIAAGLRRWGDQ